MSEEVKQSQGSQSVNVDKSNLVGQMSARKPIQFNTAALFDNYKERDVANDFSGVSQDETKTKSDLGLDI